MEGMQDLEGVRSRLSHFLNGEPLDRAIVAVTAPKDPAHPYVEEREASESWYMDPERVLSRNFEMVSRTYYAGDAFPVAFPYFGTGGHAKYFRDDVDVEYSKDTVWIKPYLDSCGDLKPADVENSRFFRRELEIIKLLAKEGKDRFFVGQPDNCGSYDALAQLRGNEELMLDFFDDPDGVKYAAGLCVDCLRDACAHFFDAVRENCLGGSCHGWMNTLAPGRFVQLQCDLSVMISAAQYEEFILPELRDTLAFVDGAFYHIDGQEQIRHLDLILSQEKINFCQWVNVAGQPEPTAFIPALRKIQQAGKGVGLHVQKRLIKPLLEALSPSRLMLIVTDASSPEEADDIVRYVYNATHDACMREADRSVR